MVDVTGIYQNCIRLKSSIDQRLDHVKTGQRLPVADQQWLQMTEREFNSAVQKFEEAVVMNGKSGNSSALWDRRLKQLTDEQNLIRQSLEQQGIQDHRYQEKARADLLGGSTLGSGANAQQNERMGLMDEREQLERAHRELDEMIGIAQESDKRLKWHNQLLKGVSGKLTDMTAKVATSTGLVKRIDRRHLEDKILVYCGMFVVVVIFVFGMWWLKWSR